MMNAAIWYISQANAASWPEGRGSSSLTWPIQLPGVNGRVVSYTEPEAQAVLAGYAFGQIPLAWNAPPGVSQDPALAQPPAVSLRSRWAYRTFDCVPTSPNRIEIEDVVMTAALDSRVGGNATLGIEAISCDLDEVLTRIPVTVAFWSLPTAHLGPQPPPTGTVSWWVWRAWTLLMGLPQVDRAITHKVLHRKRPWLFPMLDSVTSDHLGHQHAWAAIHADLQRHVQEFTALEEWFAALATAYDGVQLTRLRIHDILLWADLSGNRHAMHGLGSPFLGPQPGCGGI